MVQVTASLILAAGDSSRMGSPKPLLRLGSRTFLEVVIDKIREAKLPPPVVATSREIRKIIDINVLGVAAIDVDDRVRGNGPVESIRTWLRSEFNHEVDNLLVWPVDQPHVRTSTVLSLLREAEKAPGKAVVTPVHGGRRGHPVVFRQVVFQELLSSEADRGARAIVRRDPGRVLQVVVNDSAVVEDIDTPDDYNTLISSRKSLL